MKIRVSNSEMLGVTSERTMTIGTELHREEVERDGTYIGTVVYVRRGRDYGWRPEKAHPNSKLTTKLDAIRRLG